MLTWLISFVWFQVRTVLRLARWRRRDGEPYLARLLTALPITVYQSLLVAWKARFGRFPSMGNSVPRATMVLLSWRREANINLLALLGVRAPFIERVVVSNNDPRVRIREHVVVRSPKLILMDQPKETKQGIRFPLALQYPGEFFIFLDDDVFPTPRQLTRLYAALLRQPDVPHGYVGMRLLPASDTSPLFKAGDWNTDVQVLFRLYLCSRRVLERYMDVAETLGIVHEEFWSEDIVLSFSGAARPRIHPIGHVVCCATSDLPGTSTSATIPEFVAERKQLTGQLLDARPDLLAVRGERRIDVLLPPVAFHVR